MATNRSQVYLDANDNMSRVITQIQGSVDNLHNSLNRLGTANLGNINGSLTQQITHLRSIDNAISGIGGTLGKTALKFGAWLTAIIGIKEVTEGLFEFYKKGVQVNIDTQTAQNGIAGLITSLTNIKEEGKQLTGMEAFTKATVIAEDQVKKLRLAAIQTGVSVKEVTEAFQSGIGAGLSKGFNVDQIREVSVLVANTAKTMGMNKDQIGQELRAMLSGDVNADAQLSVALGLGPNGALQKAYKQALETGKGYDFLMKQLKDFGLAAEVQAKSLGGTFDAMGDTFDAFAGEASKSLVTSLEKLGPIMENLFNNKTGNFKDELDPVIALFNVMGDIIGDTIVNGIQTVVGWVIELGQYLAEDVTVLNTIANIWDMVTEGFGLAKDIFMTIVGIAGDLFSGVMDVFGITTSVTSELTTWQKVLIAINYAVELVKVGFALIKDVIKVVADFTRLALGGAITIVGDMLKSFLKTVSMGVSALGMQDTGKAINDFANKIDDATKRATKNVIGLNNSIANAPNASASSAEKSIHFFKNTIEQLQKSQQSFEKSLDPKNSNFSKYMDEIKKKREEGLKKNPKLDGVTYDAKNKPAKKDEKKKKEGKGEDTEKLAYENELKELEKLAQREKDINADKTRYLELDKQFNLILLKDYFDQKNTLEEQNYKTQLDYLDKELAITEEQKKNAKTMKDANKLDDKANDIINKRNKLEQDYAYNKRRNSLEQLKQIKDYSNALLELDAQIDEMTGKKGEARTIRLNIEIENMKEKYKSDPSALAKIDQIAQLKAVQEQFNSLNEDFNNLLDQQSVKEERINILKNNGMISELDQLNQIKSVRGQYIGQLTEQISKLNEVYEKTKDPTILLSIDKLKNKLLELELTVDPLKQKFDQLWEDGLSSAFSDFIDGTKSASEAFKDFTKSIEKELLNLASKAVVKQLSNALFGSMSGGSGGSFGGIVSSVLGGSGGGSTGSGGGGFLASIGSFFGSIFRASGGTYTAGQPMIVGEGGPELLLPSTNGFIANAPMTQSLLSGRSSGSTIVQNITISTPNYQSFNNSDGQVGAQMANALSRARRNM